ncbi:MAG TPA: hypothetical protein PKI03_39090, partial [Pseudomonadota bacterium]|nr:hypothetical protein [Pseudomonadota bacterium]
AIFGGLRARREAAVVAESALCRGLAVACKADSATDDIGLRKRSFEFAKKEFLFLRGCGL